MKVLIISAFPPDPAPEANHALHISEHLAESGLAVHVLCRTGSIAPTHRNIVVHPVMEDWSWSDVPRLESCLRECRPDVVLLLYIGWVYNRHPMITYLPTFCQRVLPGIPCVTQFENVDKGAPARPLVERLRRKTMALRAGPGVHWLFGTLLRDSTRIIALSTPHRASLLDQDPDVEEKCAILPPPPLIRFCAEPPAVARQHARDVIGAGPDDFVWVYWGYIYPGKGVDTLLQAFHSVSRRRPNARLVLVGGSLDFPTGPISCRDYYRMVRRLPDSLGIADRVTWTGHFNWDSDEGSRYLHAGDACVLPFDYGMTLNNSSLAAATTHGLPVIAGELPAGRDEMLEHGRNVYLCPPRDPEQLAEAMQLIGDAEDLRERLREGARKLAREWHGWEATTRRLIGILESAVSARAPSMQGAGSGLAAVTEAPLPESPATHPYLRSVRQPEEENPGKAGAPPPVSVVVAAYNVEKYLSQCLDSLVHQTLKGVEIIVVDDASTDNTPEIIEDYRNRYSNVRVIHCERNRGLATVRNIGMRAAKGEYVALTDGDDWVDTRMCEVLYRRARGDDADVLIADTTVFYDDAKTFGQFFDQHIRKSLHPRLRTMPFELASEPRVLLLEPVAWTKLYKRSFLETHALQFEDGMNSYEDICFHFSALLKAGRICLTDDAVSFYRQNRPGQISGRTSRKVFEVFDVFRRIHENLSAWDVPADIWGLLVRVQLRQFDWLLKDRVRPAHRREFMARVARQFAVIPETGLRHFTQLATADELTKLLCMRRNWPWAYQQVAHQRWPAVPRLYAVLRDPRPTVLKRSFRRGLGMLRRRSVSLGRTLISRAVNLPMYEKQWQAVNDRLAQIAGAKSFVSEGQEPLTQVCRIGDQTLLVSYPSCWSGLSDALWRMERDYYLTQMAVFRPGDTVVDVGAHVGVLSLYLAKKYPYVRIYAVEPDPVNFACLERNIELNGVANVTAINKAVSGDTDGGKRTLYIDAWTSAWASIDRHTASSRRTLRTAAVETISLERFFQEHEIRHCRLLKITAPGVVRASLHAFRRTGCVDLLCGEADSEDCTRAQLEFASWRIARQYFWRTTSRGGSGTVNACLHRLPEAIEPVAPSRVTSSFPHAVAAADLDTPDAGVTDPPALMQLVSVASPPIAPAKRLE